MRKTGRHSAQLWIEKMRCKRIFFKEITMKSNYFKAKKSSANYKPFWRNRF